MTVHDIPLDRFTLSRVVRHRGDPRMLGQFRYMGQLMDVECRMDGRREMRLAFVPATTSFTIPRSEAVLTVDPSNIDCFCGMWHAPDRKAWRIEAEPRLVRDLHVYYSCTLERIRGGY